MSEDVDVVIVGAGLAGLSCAATLVAQGRHVALLEAGDGPGGRVRTDLVDGFRLDRGFQILLTAYPEVQAQLDVDALRLEKFDPGSLVWTGTELATVADPLRRPGAVLKTLRADVGTIADKLRIAWLRQRVTRGSAVDLLRAEDRTTMASLRAAGFSEQVIQRFFRPLVGGIQLDLELETSARMFDVIFRSLATGDAAVPALGMQAIPDQLAAGLPAGTLRLDTRVDHLDGTAAVLEDGTRVGGRALVVATEGPAAARLAGLADPGSKSAAALWFRADEPPVRGRSIVLDGEAGGPIANLAVMSEVAPSYAPPGEHLVVAASPGGSADGLEPAARLQLRRWFGGAVDDWELLRLDDIPHGQPRATVPFSPKQAVSLGEGRYVTGDHRDTPSIQGAMYSGRRCAEAVLADLGTGAADRAG